MTDTQIANLVHYMPIVIRSAGLTDWERKFCASIIARGRKGQHRPTDKQCHIMDRLVREFQDATMRDEQGDWQPIGQVAAGLVTGHG